MAKLCMGCMNPLPEDSDTCAICGYSPADHNPEQAIPAGSLLQEHYIVGRLMTEQSDSLVYLGYDRQLKEPCFVQEFYPQGLCRREEAAVRPLGGCERAFSTYAEQFRTLMRTLARLRELPSMIPVYDIFEENGTLYAVSDYCQGMTLTRRIRQAGGRMSWNEARPLFMSLMGSLTRLHDAGISHLGISPDTILIGADGKAYLRGFSIAAARCSGDDLVPRLQNGYAAPEQYSLDGTVEESADVYAMAATIFRTVTGNEPPAGNKRAADSDDLFMAAEVAEELTQPVCVALFNALQVEAADRTASMAELCNELSVEPHVSALVNEVREDRKPAKAAPKKRKSGWIIALICSLVALVAVALVVVVLLQGGSEDPDVSGGKPTLPTLSTTAPKKTEDKNKPATVDKLVGKNYYDIRDSKLNGKMTVKLVDAVFSDKPAGTILSQSPEAGKTAPKETEIEVVISSGRKNEKLTVPDVSGWKEEHATLYLEALGFRVEKVLLQASAYEKGLVEGTDPAIGTEKRLGDTITLRVSNVEPVSTTTSRELNWWETPDTESTTTTTAAGNNWWDFLN